jgi:TolB protein
MEIYTYDLLSKELRRLTNHGATDYHASWTKDGKQMAFYSKRNGNADIYLMQSNGENLRQISNHPGDEMLPEISPDQTKIVFVSDRDTASRNIFLMNSDGSGVEQLTQNSDYEESPSWSPDGSSILFTRQIREKGDTSYAANGEIFKMDLSTKAVSRLTYKKGYDSGAKYAPDGNRIAFYGSEDDLYNIYLMDANGKNIINLTNDTTECYSPVWSPDGHWIAYTAGDSRNYEIWIINIHTKDKIRITDSPGRDEKPAWAVKQ